MFRKIFNFFRYYWKYILIVIATFLIVGIILDYFKTILKRKQSDEQKLKELSEQRDLYYKGQIRANKNEKWIYFTARTTIAVILLIANTWYCFYFNPEYELAPQLGINEAIILLYSFIAFSIAGTPSNFVSIIRKTIYNLRMRAHVGNINIELVNAEIETLEIKINSNKKDQF